MNSDILSSSSVKYNNINEEADSGKNTRIEQGRFYESISLSFIIDREGTDKLKWKNVIPQFENYS